MKMKLFVKYISLLILLFVVGGCKEKMADMYVTKVTDLTGEEEQVLKLEYDRDGKIIKYGDTPGGQGYWLQPFAACSAAGGQRNSLAQRSGCFLHRALRDCAA